MELLAAIVITFIMWAVLKGSKWIMKDIKRKTASEYFHYKHRKNGKENQEGKS